MDIVKVLDSFKWLTDLYILDYFVENHWNSFVPASWREYFDSLLVERPKENLISLIEKLLDKTDTKRWPKSNVVPPLSLTILRNFILHRSFPQNCHVNNPKELANILNLPGINLSDKFTAIENLDHILRINIKPKKMHEINRVYELVKILMEYSKKNGNLIKMIVDIGSGLGHLTRILSIHLDCQIKTIESNNELVSRASLLDNRIDLKSQGESSWKRPIHQVTHINEAEQIDCMNEKSILIGLHACGDLSSLIIKNFVSTPDALGLISFGCCYHKLNGSSDKLFTQPQYYHQKTFPMSKKYKSIKICYSARELACHGNEKYLERLRSTENEELMFTNPHRALFEWLIVGCNQSINESNRHKRLKGVRMAQKLNFWEYAKKATRDDPELSAKVKELESDETIQNQIKEMTTNSVHRIPIIYSLKQMIAPLIETLIIEDRKQFLEENDCKVLLIPLFDSKISPRNIALISIKKY